MKKSLNKMLVGYNKFRKKYTQGDQSIMETLANFGQKPEIMVVACCDSRVDPAVILQCDPGDLFVVRNVANIVPPYERDDAHHGTSAALEFGVRFLKVKHLVLLGHSQCGGIQALIDSQSPNRTSQPKDDFITNWVSLINEPVSHDLDTCAKTALNQSYVNCFTFPWIAENIAAENLTIHRWFFNIKNGEVFTYSLDKKEYVSLSPQL